MRNFVDVAKTDWFCNAVSFAVSRGIMSGVSATEFAPNSALSRAMLVTMLYRYAGAPDTSALQNTFADVPDSSGCWYLAPVKWAAANGIVSGYDEQTFGPGDFITREQLAAILYRFAQKNNLGVSARADLSGFADADEISGYALAPLSWCAACGIVSGVSAAQIAPQDGATRAQTAAMLMRFVQNVAEG